MGWFVFRSDTVEPFFSKDYSFSGYDDISVIPEDVEGYVWFYQVPLGTAPSGMVGQILGFSQKLEYVLTHISGNKPVVALTLEPLFKVSLIGNDFAIKEAIEGYNVFLRDTAKKHNNLKIIDFSDFLGRYPADTRLDWRFYFISQMGLNPKLARDFQTWWNHKIDGMAMKRKKCLVLDLDNTLWGGVLGEDGLSGIKIGGDYPGKAFLFFQKSLLALSSAGVILAVCSKNNEQDVIEAWEKNPFMVLRKEHFAAVRINWSDKATNLKELADELNIGLDSFVFVDDNPTERELIRQMLPMVSVPEFPAQPYDLPVFYKTLAEDYFAVYSLTAEDLAKTEQYKANAARSAAQHSFSDFGAFLESLDIQLTIEEADVFNIPRIAQMTQKTNQFNLTTRRYTESDIKSFLAQGWMIWCLGVADRFGDSGITGTVFVDGDGLIDSFLLSCRILGKGIEFAFVKSILGLLKDQGLKSVKALYSPTAKNAQVKDFYERCGFRLTGEDEGGIKSYVIDLEDADLTIDNCYHIKF